ncbi:phosphatidylinositol-specific phospholipase C domain-containing protein [Streptomyces sp. XM4193]|uniref:phosphatidylinositol-specific phospholipase C domain-containing protein n=1 Tax=Streptomyces sp. XM4193 TaxID=2929782 RepID=UPI0035AB77AD
MRRRSPVRLFRSRSRTTALLSTAALAVVAATALHSPAGAAQADPGPYSATTGVGVHNAYEKATFPYVGQALDSGAGLLEFDVWTNNFGGGWRVSHDNPLGNNNNCTNAATPEELENGDRDRDLAGCLTDLRTWSEANPGHRPIQLKIEMKDGFNAVGGRGPAEFDALVAEKLGDAVYRPAQLLGAHATLDEAVRTDGFPSREALAGKFLIHLIPGTVEQGNPFDDLWTDEEYARHLHTAAGEGNLDTATAFPAVLGAEAGDPREERYEAALRPWFVVFDGDASAYAGGEIDTAWYAERNYLLVATSAHGVAPAIDAREPSREEAAGRVAELAAGAHATTVTSDWAALPEVLATVLPRGGN